MSSVEEVTARHRKEIKALEGEMRGAVKKAKTTAGKSKKAKEVIQAVEAEYETKQKELKARHEVEVQAVTVSGGGTEAEAGADTPNATTQAVALSPEDAAEQERQHQHREKLRLKGEKAREKERLKEQEIADENANAGPAPRDVEMQVIISKLPEGCVIEEVAADGHCLYRAVAAHSDLTYTNVRDVCADALKEHEADFSPFCEYTDDIPDYATYVGRVRSSAEWGGHLELRALSMALRRPVIVYSAQSLKPLVIEHAEEQGDAVQDNPIRLSYHLNYYSLGEHYNRVVTKADDC